MPDSFFNKPFVTPALILGASIFLGTIIVSYTIYSIRALGDVITTTGSATQDVKADQAKWTVSVYRTAAESLVPSAYSSVARDAASVKAYFGKQGIADGDITMSAIYADQDYSYNPNDPTKRYNVHQDITVASGDVDKVASLAQNIGTLVSQGILVSPRAPEYYVSGLPDLRVSLLGAAIQDAQKRAEMLAKSSGSSIGKLRSASSGVVQVLAPNSTEVSDYGSYDTSTIQKRVMVTARATFAVK